MNEDKYNWEIAKQHFDIIRKRYQDLEHKPYVNTTVALRFVFDPLARRFNEGERTPELYEEMMHVE